MLQRYNLMIPIAMVEQWTYLNRLKNLTRASNWNLKPTKVRVWIGIILIIISDPNLDYRIIFVSLPRDIAYQISQFRCERFVERGLLQVTLREIILEILLQASLS
jgi:hypothetical protein